MKMKQAAKMCSVKAKKSGRKGAYKACMRTALSKKTSLSGPKRKRSKKR